MAVAHPFQATKLLADALGLSGHAIKKIVIEVAIDEVPRIYINGLVRDKDIAPLVDWVQLLKASDVDVRDDGTVVAEQPIIVDAKG